MSQISKEIEEYLNQVDPKRQEVLFKIRTLIFQEVPNIVETMKYRMPTYQLDEVVLAMASQKHYMSLYMDTELVAKYRYELSHLNCGKSCIRFKNLEELPLETIRRIIKETVKKQSQGESN